VNVADTEHGWFLDEDVIVNIGRRIRTVPSKVRRFLCLLCILPCCTGWPFKSTVEKPFCIYFDAQPWASECPNVKNYKWRLNPGLHRMLYSCVCMATVGVKGL